MEKMEQVRKFFKESLEKRLRINSFSLKGKKESFSGFFLGTLSLPSLVFVKPRHQSRGSKEIIQNGLLQIREGIKALENKNVCNRVIRY